MSRPWTFATLLLTACGRLSFDAIGGVGDGGAGDGSVGGDGGTIAPPGVLAGFGFSTASQTVIDRSGNGNDLTLASGSPMLTGAGHTGDGLTFTTTMDSFSNTSPSASLAFTTSFTLMAWVRPATVPTMGESLVVSYLERSPQSYTYGLEAFDHIQFGGEPSCYFRDATTLNTIIAAGPALLPGSVWTHLACTFDGAAIRIYVGGAVVTTSPAPTTVAFMSGGQPELIIGIDTLATSDYSYLGSVDDVRVWGRALSPAEIVEAMNVPVVP